MTKQESTTFVCMATGDMYGLADVYINRLHGMLERNCPAPFTLICITDQPRNIKKTIQQLNCSTWTELRRSDMRATTLKIGLFNHNYLKIEDFVYLDLTLVIKKDLTDMLQHMSTQSEPLVIIKDWHYNTYNSCVMRIRNKNLTFIYEAFANGETYKQKTKGDQDFVYAVIQNRKLQHLVKLLPEDYVCSLKQATRLARTNSNKSAELIENASIVKFHGNPKMHTFFNPTFHFLKYGIGGLRYGKWGLPFDVSLLKNAWTGPSK